MSYEINGVNLITPLRLSERRVGQHFVVVETIKAGEPVTVVSMRNSLYLGLRPLKAKFDTDLRVHVLKCGPKRKHPNGSMWTSDCPQELYTQAMSFGQCFGDVLVGGLGIGMAAVLLANQPGVKSVTVVEREPEIIKLIADQLPKTRIPIKIVKADLYKYLTTCPPFDSAYFDIWAPTGEGVWADEVVPLKRLVLKHHGERLVTCWLEREMIGQVRQSIGLLPTMKKLVSGGSPNGGRSVENWKQHFKPLGVFYKVADGANARGHEKLLSLYLDGPGTRTWETVFGREWDIWKKPSGVSVQSCVVSETGGRTE